MTTTAEPKVQMSEERKVAIITALMTLIAAVRQVDLAPKEPQPLKVLSIRDLMALPPETSMIEEPVRNSLRLGIKKLGAILHAEGGDNLMHEICERIDKLPENANTSFPAVLIDKCWDGIGHWVA